MGTILDATRYGRRSHDADAVPYVNFGYAVVIADARGTGASFGTSTSPFAPAEIRDDAQIVEWITRQPWSNGRVGAYGISYDSGTAELTAGRRPKGLVAVAPTYFTDDVYGDVIYPGGIFNRRFVAWWSATTATMDSGTAATPVDGAAGPQLAREAVAQHANNMNVLAAALRAPLRSDPFGPTSYAAISTATYRPALRASKLPYLVITGWLDGADVRGALRRYQHLANPQLVTIGPWNHGGSQDANPYRAANTLPDAGTGWNIIAFFFDNNLTMSNPLKQDRLIKYFTLGANTWHETTVWPPRSVHTIRLHFGRNHTLQTDASSGSDRYRVNFTATTGLTNRWFLTGGDVIYPDRRNADKKLLTYTTEPLTHRTTLTGSIGLSLTVTATTKTAALFAYLEDVAPNGKVTYITEGEQRLTSPPGHTIHLNLALIPTSVSFKSGHRIRIALAGADQDTFARTPSQGTPTLTINRSKSSVALPEDTPQ